MGKNNILGKISGIEIKKIDSKLWAIFNVDNKKSSETFFERTEKLSCVRFPADTRYLDEILTGMLKGKKYHMSGFYMEAFPAFLTSSPHLIQYSGLISTPDHLTMPPRKTEDYFFYGFESQGYKSLKSLKSLYSLEKTNLALVTFEEFEKRLGITETRNDLVPHYLSH